MTLHKTLLVLVSVVAATVLTLASTPPALINFQGFLRDLDGPPVGRFIY